MNQPRYDVTAIGNAIVDVLAQTDDAFLEAQRLSKGAMSDRKSTRLNSSHIQKSRMPSSA